MAITTDLSPFVTRPWSLFFLIIALFSAAYPLYQSHVGKRMWTLFYQPAVCVAAAVPLFMMGGVWRPIGAAVLAGIGLWTLYKRWQNGWRFEASS
jgi:putative tricarboxylic transport membrane protein